MKISVALCTYNGAAYLQEQLDSIAAQTRPPDELVACDDASSDETRLILERFSASAAFDVQLFFNYKNIGLLKNFEQAIGKCSGEIIALSDQDDVWQPEKLSRFEHIFLDDPDTGLVFSNAIVTDEQLKSTGWKLWDMTFKRRDRKRFAEGKTLEVLLEYNVVTGAAMAFRSRFRDAVLPFAVLTDFIHDGWISLVIATRAKLRFIDEPLIKYRQHSHQQLGAGLSKWEMAIKERHGAYIENRLLALKRLDEIEQIFRGRNLLSGTDLSPDRLHVLIADRKNHIAGLIEHYKTRAALPDMRISRIPTVLSEIVNGRYHKFSQGFGSAAMDLFSK
ncbi:MAG: glycosyltransferase family 2 protein [Acidobacteria bacterium]|nr:glycosyltransferase family 2 protein [Acidobacteriota bacterium]